MRSNIGPAATALLYVQLLVLCFQVCFSDESVFEILDDKSQYVCCLLHEEYSPEFIVNTVNQPTSVMVWSMVSVHAVKRLYIVQGHTNQHQ